MIQSILITSLEITAIFMLFKEGMLLGKVGSWVEVEIVDWIANPLCKCLTCMASVWGTTFWFVQWHGGLRVELLFFLLAVAGLNTVIDTFLGDKHLY